MRKGKMIKLDMVRYLGRGIQVYLKDGQAINFKPMAYHADVDQWTGINDEGDPIHIKRDEIEFVKGAK